MLFVIYIWGPILLLLHDGGYKLDGRPLLTDERREKLGEFYGDKRDDRDHKMR